MDELMGLDYGSSTVLVQLLCFCGKKKKTMKNVLLSFVTVRPCIAAKVQSLQCNFWRMNLLVQSIIK